MVTTLTKRPARRVGAARKANDFALGLIDIEGAAESLVGEILGKGRRSLVQRDGVIHIIKGQYLYQYRQPETGHVMYKLLGPAAMRAAFSDEPVDSDWLSPGVVRVGENERGKWAVMWQPPGVRKCLMELTPQARALAFPGAGKRPRRKQGDTGPRGIVELSVPLPGLVFFGIERTYYAWAVKTATFDPNAEVYYPPVPNIFPNGKVCFGENKMPECSGVAIGKAWETFELSPYNGNLANSRSKASPNDVRAQLARLAGAKATEYPLEDLEPFHDWGRRPTVEIVIDKILHHGEGDE